MACVCTFHVWVGGNSSSLRTTKPSLTLFLSQAGLMVINHVGEVVISLGGEEWEKNLCITLLAISNTIGRISVGYLADRWYRDISPSQHSHSLTHSLSLFLVNSVLHLNREWWLVGSLLLMASGHSMLFLVPYFWYTPIMTIATGLSYGGTCYPLLALLSFF